MRAADDDKAKLWDTFYLEGERITYVLIMRADKTFDLYGPDNQHINGNVRASGEHVTLTAGNVKRLFHYDSQGKDIKLGRREGDVIQKGHLLGEMPPAKDQFFRTVYHCEENWTKKGRPAFTPRRSSEPAPPVAQPQPPPRQPEPPPAQPEVPVPVVPAQPPPKAPDPEPVAQPAQPAPVQPVKPVEPAPTGIGTFNDVAGSYSLKSDTGNDTLEIQANGRFSYVRGDGMKDSGVLIRDETDVSFVSASHKRHFTMKTVAGGLELSRRNTDVVKPHETLGSMPPQERTALVWIRKGDAAPAPAPAPQAPVVVAPQPQPAQPTPQPAPQPQPAEKPPAPAAGTAVTTAKAVAGTFTHRPSPFITETLAIAEDGTFSYKDSNDAKASGTVKFENGAMVLTAGEVVRSFTATLDGSTLTLTRTDTDSPKFKNDLASMSPTVLKSAKFEKKP